MNAQDWNTRRSGVVKARTAQANQMRGLLAEFGVVIPSQSWARAGYMIAIFNLRTKAARVLDKKGRPYIDTGASALVLADIPVSRAPSMVSRFFTFRSCGKEASCKSLNRCQPFMVHLLLNVQSA